VEGIAEFVATKAGTGTEDFAMRMFGLCGEYGGKYRVQSVRRDKPACSNE
jgi:hypothetical protein